MALSSFGGLTHLPGSPVAQWVKCWPTDLAVPSSSPARGEIFSTLNGVPSHIFPKTLIDISADGTFADTYLGHFSEIIKMKKN